MRPVGGGRADGEDAGRGRATVKIGPRRDAGCPVGPHLPGDLPDMAAALYGSMVVSEGRALFLLKC